jgi:hypothetical protein
MTLEALTAKANTGTGTDQLAVIDTAAGKAGAVALVTDAGVLVDAANPVPVGVSSLPLPSGAATETTLAKISGALKAEDAVHASSDLGLPIWAVRRDVEGADTNNSGDYSAIQTDAIGRLRVNASEAMILSSYNVAGVIVINTVLLTVDLLRYNGVSIQCVTMGTAGVVTPEWSNDNTTWLAATIFTQAGASALTFNAAGLWVAPVHARYMRLRLSTATTAGTTNIQVHALAGRPQNWLATQPVSGTVTATVTAGTVNPVVPATPYILNSAATTNEALILTGTSGLQAFYATNTGATPAFVKLYNKATAPISTDVPAMILPVPAAVSGVPGVATLPIGFSGFRFALGLGIRITGAVADNDTTAVAAGQVKVMLSRTV